MLYYFIFISIFFSKQDHKNLNTEIQNKDYLLGKFNPAEHPDFVLIKTKYADKAGMYLRKEVYAAFQRMYSAALKDNIKLSIVSATRNFDYQKSIWQQKWNIIQSKPRKKPYTDLEIALKILKFSAMPGASRHHWGTDIDICNLNDSYFLTSQGKLIYAWLSQHASEYGFCQTYDIKELTGRTGYNEEKWHWSYQPTSIVFTKMAGELLKNEDLKAFSGCKMANEIDIVNNYILGINNNCK